MHRSSLIDKLVRLRIAAHVDFTCLGWRDNRVAWSETLTEVECADNRLGVLGLLLPNRPALVWTLFGTQVASNGALPLYPSGLGIDLRYALQGLAAVIDGVGARPYAALRTVTANLGSVCSRTVVGDLDLERPEYGFGQLIGPGDGATDIRTGRPEGVVLCTFGATCCPRRVGSAGDERVWLTRMLELSGCQAGGTAYAYLPLCHGSSLAVAPNGSIQVAHQTALGDRFDPVALSDKCWRFETAAVPAQDGMVRPLPGRPTRSDDRVLPACAVLSGVARLSGGRPSVVVLNGSLVQSLAATDAPASCTTTWVGSAPWAEPCLCAGISGSATNATAPSIAVRSGCWFCSTRKAGRVQPVIATAAV